MPFYQVPFTNQSQGQTNWCWAATAANCYNAIRPARGTALAPCDVVTMMLFPSPPTGSRTPCTDPGLYNNTGFLNSALIRLKIKDGIQRAPRLKDVADELSGAGRLEPKDLPREARMKEPVCAEVDFPNGATHFVAISAVDTDIQHVWIEDPELGPGHTVEFTFSDFIGNYGYSTPPAPSGGVVPGLQKVTKVNL